MSTALERWTSVFHYSDTYGRNVRSKSGKTTNCLAASAFGVLMLVGAAFGQQPMALDETCTVTVGNQTAVVLPDGSFQVPNIAVFTRIGAIGNIGPQLYRLRATCNEDELTLTGQSDFFDLSGGQTTVVAAVFPVELDPIPARISVSAPLDFVPLGESVQLTVVAHFADGTSADRTPRSEGTTYLSTNTRLLTVSQDGLVTGVSSSLFPLSATIAVLNEGNLGTINFTAVGPSNDFDNDGMPNDYEDLFGLNKFFNDANLDLDSDGLTNIQEFNLGTIPNNADTDGDGIIDGLDGDPLHPEESPPTVVITSPTDGGTLIEGQTILFSTDATDDGLLVRVDLSADTGFLQTFTAPPFETSFVIPVGVPEIVFTATATDGVPNVTTTIVTTNVIPDPLTTVIGSVVNPDGLPVEGAAITTNGDLTGTSLPDGSFSIVDVPTILGDIVVEASAVVDGRTLTGRSDAFTFVRGGTTDVGQITIGAARAIVAKLSSGSIAIVDVQTLTETSSVNLGSDVIDVAVSPDGNRALVTSFGARRVTFLDLTVDPPAVLGNLSVPLSAEDVDITCTSSGFALITDGGGSRTVTSVDVATQSIVNTITLPVTAQGVDVTPDGSLALVNAFNNNVIRVVSISPVGVVADTGVSVSSGGSGPINVTVSPNGERALVANFSSRNIGVLGIAAGTVSLLDVIPLGISPQSIVFTPGGSKAYVLDCGGGVVAVLDIDAAGIVSDSGVRTSALGAPPCFFGVDQASATPEGASVLVHTPGFVHVIDTGTNTVSGTIPLSGSDFEAGGIVAIP